MARRNLATRLRTRARPDPMRAYDALPPEVRGWLAHARLPWCPLSARRLWDRALARARGDRAQALAALERAEAAALARERGYQRSATDPSAAPSAVTISTAAP